MKIMNRFTKTACIGTLVLGLLGCEKEKKTAVPVTIETVTSNTQKYAGKTVTMTGIARGVTIVYVHQSGEKVYLGFLLKGSENEVLCSGAHNTFCLGSNNYASLDAAACLNAKPNAPVEVTGTYDGNQLAPSVIVVDGKKFVLDVLEK